MESWRGDGQGWSKTAFTAGSPWPSISSTQHIGFDQQQRQEEGEYRNQLYNQLFPPPVVRQSYPPAVPTAIQRQQQPLGLGFTSDQLKTLMAQITVFKHFKMNKTPPLHALERITSPPLHIRMHQAFPFAADRRKADDTPATVFETPPIHAFEGINPPPLQRQMHQAVPSAADRRKEDATLVAAFETPPNHAFERLVPPPLQRHMHQAVPSAADLRKEDATPVAGFETPQVLKKTLEAGSSSVPNVASLYKRWKEKNKETNPNPSQRRRKQRPLRNAQDTDGPSLVTAGSSSGPSILSLYKIWTDNQDSE